MAWFYFPVSAWKVRGESYHRMLRRIEVNGSSTRPLGGSYTFSHSYEFVNGAHLRVRRCASEWHN